MYLNEFGNNPKSLDIVFKNKNTFKNYINGNYFFKLRYFIKTQCDGMNNKTIWEFQTDPVIQ